MNRQAKVPEQLFVFTGFLVFFLITLAGNFSGPHDSIGYLNGIVKGRNLFHPHHLIYHYIAHCWLVITQPIFPGIKDYYLVESFTAIWGSGSMAVLYCFFRNRFGMRGLTSFFATAVIAFTYGVWFYSTNIEVYAPPMFLLLCTLYLLTKKELTKNDIWKIALLHCLTILFHQVNILFTPVILYRLWQERDRISLRYSLIRYAGTGIVLVGIAYFWVGWIVAGNNTMDTWMKWMEGYAGDNSYWEPPGLATFSHVGIGFSHAFIGGHYILRLPVVSEYLNSTNAIAVHSLADENFLARNMSVPVALILTALSVLLAVLMIWLLVDFIRKYRTIRQQWKHIVTPLILCGFIYSLFFCVWDPEILEFWIFQTMLVWLLLLGTLPVTGFPFRLRATVGVAVLSVLLFVINYFGSIRFIQDIKNDLYYTRVEPVKDIATPKDVILLQNGWILKDFLEYYSKAVIVDAPVADTSRVTVDNAINASFANGGKLYIYPDTSGTPHPLSNYYIDSLLQHYRDRKAIFHKEMPAIIVIQ